MKKIVILVCLVVVATTNLHAQGFLKGIQKKVESVTKKPAQGATSGTQQKGQSAEELLTQLPALLSAEAILNTENPQARQAYLNQIADVEKGLAESRKALSAAAKSREGDQVAQAAKKLAAPEDKTKEMEAKRQTSATNFDQAIAAIKPAAEKYQNELTKGYEQLYVTASAKDRDAISDKLTPINEKCHNETVEIWRAAYQQLIDDEKAMLPKQEKAEAVVDELVGQDDVQQQGLQIVEMCIKHLRGVVNFKPINTSARPAHQKVLYTGVNELYYSESFFGFAPGGAACGSFLQSEFIAVADNGQLYILADGKRKGPYNTVEDAMVNLNTKKALQRAEGQTKWQSESGKRSAAMSNYGLVLNDGSTYEYPIVVYQCNDYLYWLTYENNSLVEYSYRL